MKKRTRTPWLGVFILIAGASLCAPQVASALPGRAAVKAPAKPPAVTDKRPHDPEGGCSATFTISGSVATVHPSAGCTESYQLVSYVAQSAGPFLTSVPQTFFKASTDGTTVEIPASGPTCFWQVDYIEMLEGDSILPLVDRKHRYGEQLVAGQLGGAQCITTPPPAPSSSVLGSSIKPTTTDGKDAVLASTQTLPRTGASHVGLEALMGLALMAFGGSILGAGRRRRRVA